VEEEEKMEGEGIYISDTGQVGECLNDRTPRVTNNWEDTCILAPMFEFSEIYFFLSELSSLY
jgi:hypothetical protein